MKYKIIVKKLFRKLPLRHHERIEDDSMQMILSNAIVMYTESIQRLGLFSKHSWTVKSV